MRNLLSTLFVAGLLVAGANAQDPLFRMFFDIEGSGGADNAPHRPGNHVLSYDNPVLPAGGGRLYIYGEFQLDDQTVLSPNYDITIDGGIITQAWNYNGPGQNTLHNGRRWTAAAPNPPVDPGGNNVSFTAAGLVALRLENDSYHDMYDVQHDNTRNFGETLLGFVDVEAPAEASIWMTVGERYFNILGGGLDSAIFFGYDDDPVPAWGDPGIRTRIADATIVPEPAGFMLLGLGALALVFLERTGLSRRSSERKDA